MELTDAELNACYDEFELEDTLNRCYDQWERDEWKERVFQRSNQARLT